MSLLVVDGNSIANRAFFGIKVLTTREGQYTNAIYGFMNILLALLQAHQPDGVAIAFDLPGPTFRHRMYDGYKANRHGMPDELAAQMPLLQQLLRDLGYRLVTAEGWEADDILGTLAAACAERGEQCFLATGDRDNLQLVGDTTTVLLATTSRGHSETRVMDAAAVEAQYGVAPRQLIDVKSLMGDASDNIPGVKGIGEKTALALIRQFGSLAGVYQHIDDPAIKPRQRENLLAYQADAELSYTLGTIRTDAPVETDPAAYVPGKGDKPAAVRLLLDLEIRALIPRLGLEGVQPAGGAPDAPEAPAAPLPEGRVQPLPERPAGRWLLAARPPVYGKQGNRIVVDRPAHWYAVQGTLVCPVEDDALPRLLDDDALQLEVFDSAPLYAAAMAAGGWGASIVWDGKLAAYLLDASAAKYSVADLAERYQLRPAFACEGWPDAPCLAALFEKLKAEITALDEDFLYHEIEFPLAQVLADMTRTGILVDRGGIEQFGAELHQKIEAKLAYIRSQVEDLAFNPNSPKQLGEMLFDKMQLPHGRKTSRGWSTDNATLQKLRPDCPLIDDILQYRSYQKLYSTYAEGLLKVIGPDGGSTPPSTRPRPAPAGCRPTTPTCRTSPSAPSWAAGCVASLSQSRAACWWTPTTARSSCASWPTSPAMSTCRPPSARGRTSTAAPPPRSTASPSPRSPRGCAPPPRPSTSASCTARAPSACRRTWGSRCGRRGPSSRTTSPASPRWTTICRRPSPTPRRRAMSAPSSAGGGLCPSWPAPTSTSGPAASGWPATPPSRAPRPTSSSWPWCGYGGGSGPRGWPAASS